MRLQTSGFGPQGNGFLCVLCGFSLCSLRSTDLSPQTSQGTAAEIAKHVNFKATTLFCAPQCSCRPTKKSRSNSEYLTFATLRSGCEGRTSGCTRGARTR